MLWNKVFHMVSCQIVCFCYTAKMWFFFDWFFLCQLFSPPPCPKFVNPICSRPTCSRSFVTQSPVLNGENRREGCRVPFTTNPYRIFFRYFSILFFLYIFSLVLERRMVSNIYGVMFVIPLFTCFFFLYYSPTSSLCL